MPVTIKDLARESGVSPSTVSYVLNGGPRSVSEDTRKRVMEARDRLNFHPNSAARSLSRRKVDTIGVVYNYAHTDDVNDYFTTILHGIMGACLSYQQNTMLLTTHEWSDIAQHIGTYCDGRVDGLLVIAPPDNLGIIESLQRGNKPWVLVGDWPPNPLASCIDVDKRGASKSATEYLISMGHSRIAYFAGDDNQRITVEREQGYRLAMEEAGLFVSGSSVVAGRYNPSSGAERARTLLQLPRNEWPDAIACGNDGIAFGVLSVLVANGVRVPEDISVMGFDDVASAALAPVPLTTVHQPFREIGCRAAEIVVQNVNGGDIAVRELLPTHLVERASVGKRA